MTSLHPALKALARTILTFAIFHLTYLFIAAVWLKQWHLISLFSILDLQMVWPGIDMGARNFAIGLLVIGAVYWVNWRATRISDSASS